MPKSLSAEQDKEILTYWEANQEMDVDDVIKHFEEKFGTPITQHHIMRIMVEQQLG
jgi:hypothetical protein